MKIRRYRSQSHSRRRSRGQSLVEFALVVPVMLSLLVIAIDLGRAMSAYNQVGSMAREGALYGSLHPDDDSGISAAALAESSLSGTAPAVASDVEDDSFDVPNTTTPYQKITVTVTYDFKPLFSFPPLPDSITLRRSVEMRVTGS
jgi:Flp pilus assembly protein TadG